MGLNRLMVGALLAAGAAGFASAGGAQGVTGVQPSGLAVTEVSLIGPQGAAPMKIRIEYGQPHRRGRTIVDNLIPRDSVWRTGANAATLLVTDVDLMIGNARVPRGRYSLFTLWQGTGALLIVNRQSGQLGNEYDPTQDLARIPFRVARLEQPLESFSIWLIPERDAGPRGELRMAWGTIQYAVDWRVAQ